MRTRLAKAAVAAASIAGASLLASAGIAYAAPPTTDTTHAATPAATSTAGTVHPNSRCKVWWAPRSGDFYGYTAGYSRAMKASVKPGANGNRVREIQCLTDFWVKAPSSLDGNYGPASVAAVKKVRALCGISNAGYKGTVGEATWKCLRQY